MLFIMLNPSTADAETDDPTIRRCLGFAERHSCTRLTVVNLFAFRATKPSDLLKAEDPVGPHNNGYLDEQIGYHASMRGPIIAAWGSHPFARDRARLLTEKWGFCLQALGHTKDGSPRHPLYLPAKAELRPFPALTL